MTTKFVILSQPRTGSSLLLTALRQHPDIFVHGGLLNTWEASELPYGGRERLVAALYGSEYPVVGCNVHACQPYRDQADWRLWETLWDAVADDMSIKIIHLKRLDTTAQLASWKIANLLDCWMDQSGVKDRPKVRIDPGELYWFRLWNDTFYELRLRHLTRHPILFVTYEALYGNWDATVRRVQEFLGVRPLALGPVLKKGETRPLAEVIENYHELEGV